MAMPSQTSNSCCCSPCIHGHVLQLKPSWESNWLSGEGVGGVGGGGGGGWGEGHLVYEVCTYVRTYVCVCTTAHETTLNAGTEKPG